MSICGNIVINDIDFGNLEAMKYYSMNKSFKGNKQEKAKFMVLSGDYIGARKMDGDFCLIIRDLNGNFHMRGRSKNVQGNYTDKIDYIPQIKSDLLDLIPIGTVVLGEIYFPNNEGSRKVTSILGCLLDKALSRQEKNGYLHFYCFDVLAWNGKSLIDTPIVQRIEYLDKISQSIDSHIKYIECARYFEEQELWDYYLEVLECGGEGIVITQKSCPYLCGKRTAWKTLKLKKELCDTIDCFLTGNYKAATKLYTGKELENWKYWENNRTGQKLEGRYYKDYLKGSLLTPITKNYFMGWAGSVEIGAYNKENNSIIPIGWISGISDDIKREIVEKPEKWKYKCCEATCMEIEHIDNSYSLRHAKILQFRDDKKWQDCDIKEIWKED